MVKNNFDIGKSTANRKWYNLNNHNKLSVVKRVVYLFLSQERVRNESNERRSWIGEPSIEAASLWIALAAGDFGALINTGDRRLTARGI